MRARAAATGLVVSAAVIFGLVLIGGGVGDWVTGLGRLGGEDEAVTVEEGRTVRVTIPAGTSARGIARLLVENGVIASAIEFESAVRDREAGAQLKAGTYELVAGTDTDQLVGLLLAGPTFDVFQVTVVEGLRSSEVLEVLAEASGVYTEEDFVRALENGEVVTDYLPDQVAGAPSDLSAWEGLFFPATYEFFSDVTPGDMLQRLATEREERLGAYDWSSLTDRGFTVYEGLTMASLIESEAALDRDRPLIASVIFNRLARGMPLQLDATVLYALADRGRPPTRDDLQVVSPYNTYLINGLPPTPIGTPGSASIEAVLTPAVTDYLYYVLTSEDGSHSFFSDYEEFLDAARQADAAGIG